MIKELAAFAIVALVTLGLGTSLFAGSSTAPANSQQCQASDCI